MELGSQKFGRIWVLVHLHVRDSVVASLLFHEVFYCISQSLGKYWVLLDRGAGKEVPR